MPVTASAIKALRQDRRRTKFNQPVKTRAQSAIVKARKQPTPETVKQAHAALDKAVKKHIFKKSKADRLKSRLAKLLAKTQTIQSKPLRRTSPKAKKAQSKRSPSPATKKPANTK